MRKSNSGNTVLPPTVPPVSAAGADRERIWATWSNLDLPQNLRPEILRGAIIVSPPPVLLENLLRAVLTSQLMNVSERFDWVIVGTQAVELPATDEGVIPDLVVVPDKALRNDGWLIGPDELQLVAEVTSASTRDRDLTWKSSSYAKARIPIYLIVDRFDGEGTVTVHHEPAGTGVYRQKRTVEFGKGLRLPEPFDIELDTAELTSKQTGG